ncbi:MAG TPA: DUF6152 family protein [Candidatus Acidoferrales bacterium]|nr:DUF6152 family protein [Candidatus Acidoferrales bacterium]
MKNKLLPLLCLVLGALIMSIPLPAHHGKGAFDMEKVTVVKGTVMKFEFINPHALVYVDAAGDKGAIEHWIAESNSNNHLSRGGFDKNSLKPGDQVIVTGHRAKNGANSLELQCQECSVTDLNGKVLLGYYF